MENLLLSNLAANQAFDQAARTGNAFDRLTGKYLQSVLLQPDQEKRQAALQPLQKQIVDVFNKQVQPEARKQGILNARKVLSGLTGGAKADPNDADLRRRVLVDGNLRARDRVRIFQTIVNDQANTLDNRLAAFWLEPGSSPRQKLERLIELHTEMEEKRSKYETALRSYDAGGSEKRPRKPQLDFMSRFTQEVKGGAVEQARRSGTDAEVETFVKAGETQFAWLTVNASEACPDCIERNGSIGDLAHFDEIGRPGSGQTVCKSHCFCMIVPSRTLTQHPNLQGGLNRPPAPDSGDLATVQIPATGPAGKAEPIPPPAFPENVDDVKHLNSLGGSTGAKLVEDAHGQKFVRKTGGSPEHIREEFAAEEAYRALGVPVPDSKLYETPAGPVKLSKFVEGKTLDKLSGDAAAAAEGELKKGFVADALLGNWDSVGLGRDNVLVGDDGKTYRIDVGGSLRFRAQGGDKGKAFGPQVTELWSLQDANNPAAASVFKDLTQREKVEQIRGVLGREKELLAAVPGPAGAVLEKRLQDLRRVADVSDKLFDDAFKDDYVGRFTKHTTQLRAAGVIDRLPKKLTQGGGSNNVSVYDENGKLFDDLRGANSIVTEVAKYIDANGGSYKSLEHYFNGQAGSSWSTNAKATKWTMAAQREIPLDKYYWEGGQEASKKSFDLIAKKAGGETVLNESLAAYHAYTFEFMQGVEFPLNDRGAGTVQLMRTEDKQVMKIYKLKPGDKGVTMPRGVAESTSIYRKVNVKGTELTVQDVPHHRILGVYFHERTPGQGDRLFLGDSENEFVAMLEGLQFDYKKK